MLPTISKIIEKAVHEQLYAYLNKHLLLSERQSDFRPGPSTLTCLTEIVESFWIILTRADSLVPFFLT